MADSKTGVPSRFQVLVTAMMSGLGASLPSAIKQLMVAGTSMTIAEVVTEFQTILTGLTNVASAKIAYDEALAERKAAMAGDRTFYDNVVTALRMTIGPVQSQLSLFGISAPKTRVKLTTEQALLATAKAKATRVLRGTKGKKQKQALSLGAQPSVQVIGLGAQPSNSTAPGSPAAPVTATPVVPTTPGH